MSLGKGFGWVAGGILALTVIIPTCSISTRGTYEGVKNMFNGKSFEEGYARGAKESVKNTAKGLVGDTNGNSEEKDCDFKDTSGCDFSEDQGDSNSFSNNEPE